MSIKRFFKRFLTGLLLTGVLLSFLSACSPSDTSVEESTEAPVLLSSTPVSWVAETQLPSKEELQLWYVCASERTQVPAALLCSRQADGTLWHCWLYVNTGRPEDRITISQFSQTPHQFSISMTSSAPAETDEEGNLLYRTEGVYYFTVSASTSPRFSLSLDGEEQGIILTIAQEAIVP